MAGEEKIKLIEDLDPVTLPMTGAEHIMVVQGGVAKRMHPGDFPAVIDGFVKLDGTTPFQGEQSMNAHKLTDLAAPENDNDAARLKDLTDRTGWVKVIPLAAEPETWENNSLYLIQKTGFVQAYLTNAAGAASSIGNTLNVVNKINDTTGGITVGINFTGGKASIRIGDNTPVDLDARYLQIANYEAPALIPNDIEIDDSDDATKIIGDGTTLYNINPASLVAAMTRQLPSSPAPGQIVRIKFGGTIDDSAVVTAFTLTCDEAHEIFLNPAETGIECSVSDVFVFQFFDNRWFRLDKNIGNGGLSATGWAKGDLFYADTNGDIKALAKGSDGNIFELSGGLPTWADVNGASKLVRLDASARLPAVDGSMLTNLPSFLQQETDRNSKVWTLKNPGTGGGYGGGYVFYGGSNNAVGKVMLRLLSMGSANSLNDAVFFGPTTALETEGIRTTTNIGLKNKITTPGMYDMALNLHHNAALTAYSRNNDKSFGIFIGGNNTTMSAPNGSSAYGVYLGMQVEQRGNGYGSSMILCAHGENALEMNEVVRLRGWDNAIYAPGRMVLGADTGGDASAILDIISTDKGVLFPRMTNTQFGMIASKAEGLHAWSTDDHAPIWWDGSKMIGFKVTVGGVPQYFDGTNWNNF